MNISELIAKLQEARREYGDLRVFTSDEETYDYDINAEFYQEGQELHYISISDNKCILW